MIEEAVASMRGMVSEKGLLIHLDLAPVLPSVTGDKSRLLQLIVGLLSNACKYTETGGIITVAATAGGGCLQVEISDTGVGISSEDQARLFTKFFRADDVVTRQIPGSGLGLFIARHLVEAHEGTMCVESEQGLGSKFKFSLPVERAKQAVEGLGR